jgi:Transglutaminase-like superfamily
MAAWSMLLPVLKRAVPLRRLVVLMWTTGGNVRSEAREQAVIALSARVARVRPRLRSNCLERSLLAYRFLAQAGADPRLVLAVGSVEGGVVGHAWVTLDGKPVHEPRAAVESFAPLIEFGPRGEATDFRQAGHGEGLPRVWR